MSEVWLALTRFVLPLAGLFAVLLGLAWWLSRYADVGPCDRGPGPWLARKIYQGDAGSDDP